MICQLFGIQSCICFPFLWVIIKENWPFFFPPLFTWVFLFYRWGLGWLEGDRNNLCLILIPSGMLLCLAFRYWVFSFLTFVKGVESGRFFYSSQWIWYFDFSALWPGRLWYLQHFLSFFLAKGSISGQPGFNAPPWACIPNLLLGKMSRNWLKAPNSAWILHPLNRSLPQFDLTAYGINCSITILESKTWYFHEGVGRQMKYKIHKWPFKCLLLILIFMKRSVDRWNIKYTDDHSMSSSNSIVWFVWLHSYLKLNLRSFASLTHLVMHNLLEG